MRKSDVELFRYYKGRDMHNHGFLDKKTLLQEHFKQKVQISNETENLGIKNIVPDKIGVNAGDHSLYQSLQQHFNTI